jgi:hypothetical protein
MHRVGPLSLVTQWPLERTIGNLGQEVKQHSNPFANLSERGLQRSQINALKAMIPDLDQAKSLPRGSKDLGDGYVLLRAMDQTFRHPRQCESVAIRHFLTAAGLDTISPEFTISIRKWARLSLPNGQIARSYWKEKEKQAERVRMARNVKVCVLYVRSL